MGNSRDEVRKIVMELDKKFTGKRTSPMLHEWVCLLAYFPLRNVKAIEKKITFKFNYWPTIEQMLEVADKVTEEIKLQERNKPAMGYDDVFNFNRLPKQDKATDSVAEIYCALWKKHIVEGMSNFEGMAKEMIEIDSSHPGFGLKECGEKTLRDREISK